MLIVRVKKFTLMVRVAGLHGKSNLNLICKEKDSKTVVCFCRNCFRHLKYDWVDWVSGEIRRCQLNNP